MEIFVTSKNSGGKQRVVLWGHFVRGLSGYFKEDFVERTFTIENERGGELEKMEFFVTTRNGGGNRGGDFMTTFCSWLVYIEFTYKTMNFIKNHEFILVFTSISPRFCRGTFWKGK